MTKRYEKLKWHNNAKCAVLISFDLDGDTIWKNGNRRYENGEKFIRSTSIGNYGPQKACENILDMLDRQNIKSSFFIPAKVVEDYPKLCKNIKDRGHEIGVCVCACVCVCHKHPP